MLIDAHAHVIPGSFPGAPAGCDPADWPRMEAAEAGARDLARWISEYVASLCAAAPGRIYGLGTVPLQDPGLAAAELSAVAGLGLAGVEIASNVGEVSLGDPRFGEFF